MRFYLLIILTLILLPLNSQDYPVRTFNLNPESPNAMQFRRYDDFPVSEYTGIPEISIPFYTINIDGVTVPITLTYHSGGIKVNQDASWVGLGWDLTSSCITQYVNDNDDFDSNVKKILPDYMDDGDNGTRYNLYPASTSSKGLQSCGIGKSIIYPCTPNPIYNFWLATEYCFPLDGKIYADQHFFISHNRGYGYDSEPDVFVINLFGITLKAVNDWKKNEIIVLNKKGYTVKKEGDSWSVKTPDGETYYFNDTTYSVPYIATQWGENMGLVSSTRDKKTQQIWMLNKIITKNNREINFSYTKTSKPFIDKNISYSADYTYTKVKETRIDAMESSLNCLTCGEEGVGIRSQDESLKYFHKTTSENKEHIFYLKEITFPGGYIDFTTSERKDLNDYGIFDGKKLDRIELFNHKEKIKTFEFVYDYFKNYNGTLRLKLNALLENDTRYTFSYNETPLPGKNSFQQDYWGYYNNAINNKNLIPNPKNFNFNLDNGNDLSSNLSYTKAAILENIKYPTGGSVSFEYELNEFFYKGMYYPADKTIGDRLWKGFGLRVKQITYFDEKKIKLKSTNYQYEDGVALIPTDMVEKFEKTIANFSGGNRYVRIFSADILSCSSQDVYSSNLLSSQRGVGYGKVTKYIDDKDKAGYIETYYHNKPDQVPNIAGNLPAYIAVPVHKKMDSPENGQVQKVLYSNKDKSLVKEINYKYQNSISECYYGARMCGERQILFTTAIDDGPSILVNPQYLIVTYPIIDKESLLMEKVEKDYFGDKIVLSTEKYSYNDNNLISTIERMGNENSRLFKKHTIYENPVILSEPTQIYQEGFGAFHIIRDYHEYNKALLSKESLTVGKSVIDPISARTVKYDSYDSKGNLLQKIDLNNVSTIYLWSYSSQHLIAEIQNATYTEVAKALVNILGAGTTYETLSSMKVPDETKLLDGSFQKSLPNALVTTYTYTPLIGVATATDPRGFTTYYKYDLYGRLIETYVLNNGVKNILKSLEYNYLNKK